MANCKKKYEVKQVGYKYLEHKVYNRNTERHSMITATVGTIVIKYLNEKEKSLYASQRLVDFRGKLCAEPM